VSVEALLLHGGEVYDPRAAGPHGARRRADVLLVDGRVAAVGTDLEVPDGGDARDCSGLVVTPGLVDLHTHVFVGQDLGVDPDVVGPPAGTTTFVDTGSAGAHLFGAFRRGTIDRAGSRVRAFLNIASIGATSILLAGELENLAYADEDACIAGAREHADRVIGIKVRASGNVVGRSGAEPMHRARRVADQLGLPLMVHLGPAPPGSDEIMATLRAGDVLTHCYTGFEDNRLSIGGRVRESVLEARQRGVVFDVAHGMSAFDAEVASEMLAAGFRPDTISSDVHAYSLDAVGDLPTVMSKFLALGLPLDEVLLAATYAPARHAGLAAEGVGTLDVGAPADVAAFELVEGSVAYADTRGGTFHGTRRLRTALTVRAGVIVHEALKEGRQ
jgi:dihydroorotase